MVTIANFWCFECLKMPLINRRFLHQFKKEFILKLFIPQKLSKISKHFDLKNLVKQKSYRFLQFSQTSTWFYLSFELLYLWYIINLQGYCYSQINAKYTELVLIGGSFSFCDWKAPKLAPQSANLDWVGSSVEQIDRQYRALGSLVSWYLHNSSMCAKYSWSSFRFSDVCSSF